MRVAFKALLQLVFQTARRLADFCGSLRRRAGIGCTGRCLRNQFQAFRQASGGGDRLFADEALALREGGARVVILAHELVDEDLRRHA